jgi:hypothetical protein
MATATTAGQTRRVGRRAPSEYEIQTGKAFHAPALKEAKQEGAQRGALTGLGIGAGIGGAGAGIAATGVASGVIGAGALKAGGLAAAATGVGIPLAILLSVAGAATGIGALIGKKRAKTAELKTQKEGAKQSEIAKISAEAQSTTAARARREEVAGAKLASGRGMAPSTATPDEQVLAQSMTQGPAGGLDMWHQQVYGPATSV